MAKVFISYSRKDMDFAKRLTGDLQKSDLDFWIDWEGIPPTVEWWKEIEKGIEEADIFLFLISPDSAKSKVCGWEIDVAVKNGKRLIPVVVRDVKADEAPQQLQHLNWIFFRESDEFESALKKLLTSIHTDYAWVQEHRWLQVRALEWDRESKEDSFLLRGKDLEDAELQLATNTSKDPHPTDLQREYVFASRKVTNRQRRLTTGIVIAGSVVLAVLAAYGILQARSATQNADASQKNAETAQAASTLAVANQQLAVEAEATTASNLIITQDELRKSRNQALSAQSELLNQEAPSASMLLALEAIKLNLDAKEPVSNDSYQALRDAISSSQGIAIDGNAEAILVMKYSQDGGWFAAGGKDRLVRVWDTKNSRLMGAPLLTLDCKQGEIQHLFFSRDGERLVTAGSDKVICIWDLSAPDPSQSVRQITTDLPAIDAFAVSVSGQWIAAGNTEANQVLVWDLEKTQDLPFEIRISDRQPSTGPLNLVFNPEASLLLVANDSSIEFWSVGSTGPSRIPGGGIFDPLLGKTYYVWMTGTQGLSNLIHVRQLQFTPDGKRIIGLGFSDNRGYVIFILNTATFLRNPKFLGIPPNYERIQYINLSPDGRWLAGGNLNTIWVWDIAQNRNPFQLDGHQAPINALEFSSDGRWLASATGSLRGDSITQGDGTVRIWDLSTNAPNAAPIIISSGFDNKILAFDKQGEWLAISSENRLIRLFDLVTKRFSLDPLEFYEASAKTAYSYRNYHIDEIYWNYLVTNQSMNWLIPHLPKGWKSRQDYFASSIENFITYSEATIGAPDLRETYLLSDLYYAPTPVVTNLGSDAKIYGYGPGGKNLIYGMCDEQDLNCEVFEIDVSQEYSASAQSSSLLKASGPTISKVRFTADNRWMIVVASSGYGEGSYLVNLSEIPLHLDSDNYVFYEFYRAVFADRWMIVNSESGATFYDLTSQEPIKNGKFKLGISALAISPDGLWLVYSVLANGNLGLLDLSEANTDTDKNIELLPSAVTPEGYTIAFKDRIVNRVDFDRWMSIYQYEEDISFSADSRWLSATQCLTKDCVNANFYIWDLSNKNLESARIVIPLQLNPHLLWHAFTGSKVFSPDQLWLGLLDNTGNLSLLDLSGDGPATAEFSNDVLASSADFAFSPDGLWFAVVDQTGGLSLHSLSNIGDEWSIPNTALHQLASVTFSSDKNNVWMAGGTSSGKVLLWNMDEFLNDPTALPIVLQGGTKVYDEVSFSPDNKWVFAYGLEEPLKAWRVEFEDVLKFACEVAGRNFSLSEWEQYGFTEAYRATCSLGNLQTQVNLTTAP